jgi:acyl-CoA thioesterase-1
MNKFKRGLLGATALGAALLAAGVAPAAAVPVEIVALGDSLTAGYGVDPGQSFPEQLQAALVARGHDASVVNAGVSGDTSADGLARLEWSVPAEADIVIVALGANDALRGLNPKLTRQALDEILAKLTARGQIVLLAGMLAPRNLGDEYGAEFDAIYPGLAVKHGVAFYPFFLEGVATDPALNQADGIHPTAMGIGKVVDAIVPLVEELVEEIAAGR